jgi:hypothetical protein
MRVPREVHEAPDLGADKSIVYTGPALLPEANELGWKDTVRADPEMVTRIIVKFEGYVGRYVWHCHLLEHEDNEMMRPYDVIAPTTVSGKKTSVAASGARFRVVAMIRS